MYENLLDKSKELVNKIYDSMNVIEQCNIMADKIKGLPVCFVGEDSVIDLDKVINADQMNGIRDGIILTIQKNAKDAENYLAGLTGAKNKPAIINQDFEDAVNEMVEQAKDNEVAQKKVELNVNEVKELYINKDYTIKQLCDHFHVGSIRMSKFIKENGLVKKRTLSVIKIRDMYTNMDMTLEEIAKELGYTKAEIYDFMHENGIRRPAKKNKGFRD